MHGSHCLDDPSICGLAHGLRMEPCMKLERLDCTTHPSRQSLHPRVSCNSSHCIGWNSARMQRRRSKHHRRIIVTCIKRNMTKQVFRSLGAVLAHRVRVLVERVQAIARPCTAYGYSWRIEPHQCNHQHDRHGDNG